MPKEELLEQEKEAALNQIQAQEEAEEKKKAEEEVS